MTAKLPVRSAPHSLHPTLKNREVIHPARITDFAYCVIEKVKSGGQGLGRGGLIRGPTAG